MNKELEQKHRELDKNTSKLIAHALTLEVKADNAMAVEKLTDELEEFLRQREPEPRRSTVLVALYVLLSATALATKMEIDQLSGAIAAAPKVIQ